MNWVQHRNSHVRWAGPYSNYAQPQSTPSHTMHVPWVFGRKTAVLIVLATGLIGGVTAAMNALASKQVAYQATINQPVVQPAQAPPANVVTPSPPTAPVVVPVVLDNSAKVQTVLDSWAATHPTQIWSVVVQGLGADATKASLKPDASMRSASIYKIFTTYPLFQKYSLDDLSSNYISVEGKGSVTLKTCVDLMIRLSDNPCGEAVASKIGWAKTTTALRQLGMASTNLNTPDYAPITTARDTALFLEKLHNGQLYDSSKQQYIVGLMQQQKNRKGIPAGCAGCVVADKNGDLGFVRHDAGIVQHEGGSYVLAIFTNGASYNQIAELTSQLQAAIVQ